MSARWLLWVLVGISGGHLAVGDSIHPLALLIAALVVLALDGPIGEDRRQK